MGRNEAFCPNSHPVIDLIRGPKSRDINVLVYFFDLKLQDFSILSGNKSPYLYRIVLG
jgi:hypothetical protein